MSGYVQTGTYLDRILAQTAVDLAARKEQRSLADLELFSESGRTCFSLESALRQECVTVISEIKRASPSKGRFPVEVIPADVAASYIAGGVAAISVLTDEPYFQGSLEDMSAAAAIAHGGERQVPILRKDFVIDPYQLVEAKAFGADAALLIVAALEPSLFAELSAAAAEIGLSTLVEVHDEAEMDRAIAAGSQVIGINNRDLRSFHLDLAVTERIAAACPADRVLVSESGIFSRADVERVERAGASAILVGEALIVASDRAAILRELTSVPRTR